MFLTYLSNHNSDDTVKLDVAKWNTTVYSKVYNKTIKQRFLEPSALFYSIIPNHAEQD